MKHPYKNPYANLIWRIFGPDVTLSEGTTGRIHTALSTLTEREEAIIKARFGIYPEQNPLTLSQIAGELILTRQRIQGIEAKALRKLRHPSRSAYIRGLRPLSWKLAQLAAIRSDLSRWESYRIP